MKPFNFEEAKQYKLFYLLKKINASSPRIVLSHQQSHINAVVTDYELFRMADNSVLVAFSNPFLRTSDYNYVASDGRTEEVIVLQAFERIAPYYKLGPEIHQSGSFVFTDSIIPRVEGEDWRCDNQKYGPKAFTAVREDNRFFKTVNEIEVYEPIFSINSIGHIVYIKQVSRSEDSDEILNNSYMPFACYTLPEVIKLTLEWASMNNETFQNYEDIAVKANKFVNALGITPELVANQPDMQVYEFLKGNPNARQRPDGVQASSEELDKFIQNSLSYFTLSKLIALNPTTWNLSEVLELEKAHAVVEWEESLTGYRFPEIEYGDLNTLLEYAQENMPTSYFYFKLYFGVLTQKKALLDALTNEG